MAKKRSAAEQKRLAAKTAVEFIENDMVLGLGTGSTVEFALTLIAEKVKKGLRISCIPTSIRTEKLSNKLGIALIDHPAEVTRIDLAIDGADEADERCFLIKGGGGALTREKIIASVSDSVIIIVDQSKLKQTLGAFPLPVEVLPFGWRSAAAAIRKLGAKDVDLRRIDNKPFMTDNGNWILDCRFEEIHTPEALALQISQIPAVVEHGLFIGLCDRLIIGHESGEVRQISAQ